jgi:hypothetical protein
MSERKSVVSNELEPNDMKVSRSVLRGEKASNDLTYPTTRWCINPSNPIMIY